MDGQHQEEATDGTYLAIISNYFQPNHAKPRCVGSISIAKPALCSLRRFADRVFIDEVDGEVWRLIPLSGSSDLFMIVSTKREPGCLRYLGSRKDCNDTDLKLYSDFDGSGLQRSPPPPVLLGPGKPSQLNAVSTVTSTVAIPTWEDGEMNPGSTAETYEVRCVAAGSGCSGLLRGNPEIGIVRGTQQGQVTGLQYRNEWKYACFVVAENAGGKVWSDPIDIFAPDTPVNVVSVQLTQSTWTASWDVGVAGYPEEKYSLKCVYRGAGCNAPPLGVSSGLIERRMKQGSVLTLPSGTFIDCYVIAGNSAGRVCSSAQVLLTPKRVAKPVTLSK